MTKSNLGGGDEYGMVLLAGFSANEGGGSQAGRGGRGIAALAISAVARVAVNLITTGSVTGGGLRPGDVTVPGGGGDREAA